MRVLLTSLILAVLTISAWGQNITTSSLDSKPPDKSKKVSHIIYEIQELHQSISLSSEDLWDNYRAKMVGDSIQVEIQFKHKIYDSDLCALRAIPGRIQRYHDNRLQMLIHVNSINYLENHEQIALVKLPEYVVLQDIVSEGIDTIGIPKYHEKGYLGQGTKIAILDGGFQDYSFFMGSELPTQLGTKQFGLNFESFKHGTQCAQVVFDIAPYAEYWLVQIYTELDFIDACDWMKGQGIDLISCSLAFFNVGWNDGTSIISQKIDELSAEGILWVNSAANYADKHWTGFFNDNDYDNYHNFLLEDEMNDIFLNAGQSINIFLTWNDWPLSNNDYDLYLYRKDPLLKVDSSIDPQSGLQRPIEIISYTATISDVYGIVIRKYAAPENKTFHLFVKTGVLEYKELNYSIPPPGDAVGALTVGAVPWSSPHTIEPFSSRGPTDDLRIKPELVAPDNVSVLDISGIVPALGTSFSCPHVAGAAAVYLSYKPEINPADLIDTFKTMCIDLGTPGPDNTYGWGLLHLPDPNRAPYFYGLPSDITISENQNYQLQIAAEDPDEDYLIYSANNLPEGSNFDIVSHYFLWQPTYEQSGYYPNVQFIVSDGQLSDTAYINFTVSNTNRPPTLASIGDKQINENQMLIFNVVADDPDEEDNLSYWSKNLPSGASFSQVAGSFVWMPTYEQAGVYSNIILGVTDTKDSASDTISITVNNINRPPSAFSLIYPADEDSIETDTTTLVWNASHDPDIDDELIYKLYYSESDTSTWQNIIDDIEDTAYHISDLSLINNTYYWKVLCYDNYESEMSCNSTFRFVSADLIPPSFTIDVLPNPIFGNELDIYAYPSEEITASPKLIFEGPSTTDTTDMNYLTNRNLPVYVADYQIGEEGSYNLMVCGTDAAGNEGCTSLGFAAAPLFVGNSAFLEDESLGLHLSIPADLIKNNGIIISTGIKYMNDGYNGIGIPFNTNPLSLLEFKSNNSFLSGYANLSIDLDKYRGKGMDDGVISLLHFKDGYYYLIPAQCDHVSNTLYSKINQMAYLYYANPRAGLVNSRRIIVRQ